MKISYLSLDRKRLGELLIKRDNKILILEKVIEDLSKRNKILEEQRKIINGVINGK